MINENALLKTASVNDKPAADQDQINNRDHDRDVLCLLSNVLFLYVSYLLSFVTGQQTVLFKFSYMLYMDVFVCVNVFYGVLAI